MTQTIFIPLDSVAVALGADDVARAIEEQAAKSRRAVRIVRTGSRGMHWLEPLVEIERGGERYGFGPVEAADVPSLFAAISAAPETPPAHAKAVGKIADIPYFKSQTRLIFARCGVVDPLSLNDYRAHGGLKGLQRVLSAKSKETLRSEGPSSPAIAGEVSPKATEGALSTSDAHADGARAPSVSRFAPDTSPASGGGGGSDATESPNLAICEAILASGLRGRGGAGFPAGIKWKTVAGAAADQKYVVCNADEGDSGTFADRMIMEGDPFLLIEGMIIAGIAVGATQGYVYLRSEYPVAARVFEGALKAAYAAGVLGPDVLGSGKRFDLDLFIGAGAYICGEETSLLNSLEGRRGEIRAKPPLPALEGLFGKPTLVHNVISLCAVPAIIEKGADFYKNLGVGKSTGTMPFQLAGNVKYSGLYEAPFGMTLGDLVMKIAGGTRNGRPVRAVQIGGPLGAYLPPSLFAAPIDYEALTALGAGVGHGGLVVFDDTVDLLEQARYAFEFCAEESCGKCTPCRIGAVRGVELIDRIKRAPAPESMELLHDLCDVMTDGSLCAMGGMTPIPVTSALKHFPEDFGKR